MTPEKWEQVTKIYHSALEIGTDERKAFLKKACAGDESLCREVESLLLANSEANNFINEPVFRDIADLLKNKNAKSLIGQTLGHYQILSRIGVGGMGEVYLAKDLKLNRSVALKTLPPAFTLHQNYLRRFKTEVRAAATLNHPNVATIYSVEEVEGQPFFTMEYVKGKTLDVYIPENGLNLKTFLEWFVQISDAISHAHGNGIVHRDIKPGNIMITADGVPKILDFGLALIDRAKTGEFTSTQNRTHTGQVIGTPSYMSPEQAEGKQVDHCSDIFSLGVVMYEAMTGERPFKGDSYASIVSALLTKEPPPVNEVKPEIPFLLARLIVRCLEKEPRKRLGSMGEVRVILEEIQAAANADISADISSIPLQSKSKSFSRLWLFAPLTLISIALLSFAVYRFVKENSPPIHFGNITLRKLSQTNNVVYAQITPDGNAVAYNTIEADEKRALWIRHVDDKNALQLVPPQAVFFWGGLTISPDGGWIYYITADRDAQSGTLYRISSLGGAPRKLVETVNDLGSLSPDGERVLYVRYGEKMQLLSAKAADGGDEQVIHMGEANHIVRDPQFSPDGSFIFFIKFERINGEEFWSLVEIPAEGGRRERVIIPSRKPKINEIAVLKDGEGLLINAVDAISNLPQLFHVSLADSRETRVTNDLNSYFGISVSDDDKTIVTAQRNIIKDIWVSREKAKPAELRKLTTESNIYSNAVWTADGKIVFDAVDNNRPHIWIMNGDGSNPQQLTPNDSFDYEPQISPDGRFIVFTSQRTGETKVWRMNVDGSNPHLLTPMIGAAYNPTITPDGKTVLFFWRKENQRFLGRIPLSGGEAAEQPLFSESYTALSPNGKLIAFAFFDESNSRYKVRVQPIEKDEPATVLNISPINFLIWTADGKSLLYRKRESDADSDSTVWLQPVSGGEPKPFLSVKPETVFNVAQSTNGKQTIVVRGRLITDAVMLTGINGID